MNLVFAERARSFFHRVPGFRLAATTILCINVLGGAMAAVLLVWGNALVVEKGDQSQQNIDQDSINQARYQYDRLRKKVPREPDINARVKQLLEAGKQFSITFHDYRPLPNPIAQPSRSLDVASLALRISGSYSNLIGFVDFIENGKFPLRLTELSLSRVGETGMLQVNLVAAALVSTNGDPK